MFLFGIQYIRWRGEIGVPRIFAGDERLFPREQHARVFEPFNDESSDTGLFEQHFERKRSSSVGENFADSLFGLADGAFLSAWTPGDNFLLSRLSMTKDFVRGEITTAHKFFGGRLTARHAPDAGGAHRMFFRPRGIKRPQKFQLGLLYVGLFFLLSESLHVGPSALGEPIFAIALQLDFRRERRAESLADRREVIAADPVAELDELRRECRQRIQQLSNFFDSLRFGSLLRESKPDANRRAIAKRHQHSPTDQFFAIE